MGKRTTKEIAIDIHNTVDAYNRGGIGYDEFDATMFALWREVDGGKNPTTRKNCRVSRRYAEVERCLRDMRVANGV